MQPARRKRRRCARRNARSSRFRTIAATLEAGDSVVLIVEDDPHYARIMLGAAKEQGFKVLVAQRGADALALARDASADRHLARYLSAGHAGVDGVESTQAGSGDAAHSRANRDPGRGSPPWAGERRVCVRAKARHSGGPRGRVRAHQRLRGTAPQASVAGRGRRGRTQGRRGTAQPRGHRNHDRGNRRGGAWRNCTRRRSIASCSI